MGLRNAWNVPTRGLSVVNYLFNFVNNGLIDQNYTELQ